MDTFDRAIILFFIFISAVVSIVCSMDYTDKILCQRDDNVYIQHTCLKDMTLVK